MRVSTKKKNYVHDLYDMVFYYLLAGMWGAQLTNNREKLKWLCFEMMSEKNGEKGNDQEILKKYLWSIMKCMLPFYKILQKIRIRNLNLQNINKNNQLYIIL